ncbi:unnamed protein product [Ixodes pacificus]
MPDVRQGLQRLDGGRRLFRSKAQCLSGRSKVQEVVASYFLLPCHAAIVNAFVQHTAYHSDDDVALLHFKVLLGRQLIKRHSFRTARKSQVNFQRKQGRRSGSLITGVPNEIRLEGRDHFPKENAKGEAVGGAPQRVRKSAQNMCAAPATFLCVLGASPPFTCPSELK